MRLLTAIAMIGICGFAAARGWGIVHFSADMASSGSSERRPEIINKWTSTPYVASAALRAELREQTDSEQSATNRRWDALSSMLAIRPLSSVDWLSLSILQRATDQPMENVFRSLEMSILAGPNEGYVMTNRGIFAASLWESLSPDLKNRVTNDIAWGDPHELEKLRRVLFAKSESVRKELRAALLKTGRSPKEIEMRLGRELATPIR